MSLHAQDPFEIQVYEYETVKKGLWDLETHFNYIGKGSKTWDGPAAPSNNQFHSTFEFTRGVTDHFELAGYLLFATRPGANAPVDFAGYRFRPRYSVPESVRLPLGLKFSIGGEVDFTPARYSPDTISMEVRPILERSLGRWQFDFNPAIEHSLRGPSSGAGWEFGPAARVAFQATARLQPSLEYYASFGPEQVHQLYPGADIKLSDAVVMNLGVGFAATPAGDRLIFKTRFGFMLGKQRN